MTAPDVSESFSEHSQTAETTQEQIEQNKTDMGMDESHSIDNESHESIDTPSLDLEMPGISNTRQYQQNYNTQETEPHQYQNVDEMINQAKELNVKDQFGESATHSTSRDTDQAQER